LLVLLWRLVAVALPIAVALVFFIVAATQSATIQESYTLVCIGMLIAYLSVPIYRRLAR
jgi:hypothetical protein